MSTGGPKAGFSKKTVRLKQVDWDTFELEEDSIDYTDSAGGEYSVTKDEINELGTDLASVPSMLWWYVGSYGRHTQAALLHDGLVRRTGFERSKADWVFRDALMASGVPMLRRGLMWAAVSLETTFLKHFSGGRATAVRIAHLLAVIGALAYWIAGRDLWSWRGLLTLALAGSYLTARRRAGAALLVDHVILIVGALCFWLVGERPLWQAAVFGACAASWFLWGRRSLWLVFGIVVLVPAGALVFGVRGLIGILEKVVAPVVYVVKLIAWKLGRAGPDERPIREKPKDVFKPTVEL